MQNTSISSNFVQLFNLAGRRSSNAKYIPHVLDILCRERNVNSIQSDNVNQLKRMTNKMLHQWVKEI